MSFLVPVTRKEIRALKKQLRKPGDIHCLDGQAYVKTLLVAQAMMQQGELVKAQIVKPKEMTQWT
jgi:hypothetical protein